MNSTERPVHVRLVCTAPPSAERAGVAVEFGLQDKRGHLAPGTSLADGSLAFEGDLHAIAWTGGAVRLRGTIVHGTPADPFLYLSCRPTGNADAPWIFRLKVPLRGLVAQLGDGDPAIEPVRFEGRVRATGGGSVPLLGDGWERR